jgi:hypothetical protein
MKAPFMPPIVELPTIVQAALTAFGDLLTTDAARRHCAAYLPGLVVAERTTGSGINRALVVTTDQSCLHRGRTEVEWDVQTLNDRRLAWLPPAAQTRYSVRGVLASDHTLVTHEGKLIDDVGGCWDQADQRHVIAHDDIISNYGGTSGAPAPIAGRRCKKRTACAVGEGNDHTALCMALIEDTLRRGLPGDCTFESYCTSATMLQHIERQPRAYVGDWKLHRQVVYAGRAPTL